MELANWLASVGCSANTEELRQPKPEIVQRWYRRIMTQVFGIPAQALQQSELCWISQEMAKDRDLFDRSEGVILLTRFVQSVLGDHAPVAEDERQFGVGDLIDPSSLQTRVYIEQLSTIGKLKQLAAPFYDQAVAGLEEDLKKIRQQEEKAVELEAKLERLTAERAARLRMDEQLCRQKAERTSALEAVSRTASEAETRLQAAAEHVAKLGQTVAAKRTEEAAARRTADELAFALVKNPEALREKVEEMRARIIDRQLIQDMETRAVNELEQREEQCRHAANTMSIMEDEMGVASRMAARLTEALGEMHEKEAVLEELCELIASKNEGVEKKRVERGAFRARHEEERREQRERMDQLSSCIVDMRAECDRLRNLEGSVKKEALEQRAKLARLRNEKNAEISTLTDYVATRSGLLQKMEEQMVEKQVKLQELEFAYEEGLRSLSDAMTTADLDVTATMTMKLLG